MNTRPPGTAEDSTEGSTGPSSHVAAVPTALSHEGCVEGQLNLQERDLLFRALREAAARPRVVLEVGTWLGGGSTLHILRALEKNGQGHLWGIEADRNIYERMLANLRAGAPEALHRFTPLFGFSQQVIPKWIAEQPSGLQVDFVFLDGGNRPLEQVTEFDLLDPYIPVGGQLMAHDARLRKGKWFVPYISLLDHWRTQIHDVSAEGLLHAKKLAAAPPAAALQAARRTLLRARLEPAELAALIVPRPLRRFILGLMPRKFSVLLSDGRKPG